MSKSNLRIRMVQEIVNFEARRDGEGRLVVYKLPRGDGGGRYEVAGINEKYHKAAADYLVELVEAGRQEEAEAYAIEYIANYTDRVGRFAETSSVEFYLRDSSWNRGPGGASKILQMALAVKVDGHVGPKTLAALRHAETDVEELLKSLRVAREAYERKRGRNESSKFWKGLVNRWNKALAFAQSLNA